MRRGWAPQHPWKWKWNPIQLSFPVTCPDFSWWLVNPCQECHWGQGSLWLSWVKLCPISLSGSWGCGLQYWWSTPPTRLSLPSPSPTMCCSLSSPPASPQSLAFDSWLPSAYVSAIWALLSGQPLLAFLVVRLSLVLLPLPHSFFPSFISTPLFINFPTWVLWMNWFCI